MKRTFCDGNSSQNFNEFGDNTHFLTNISKFFNNCHCMQHSKLFSHSLVWKCFLSNMNDSLTCIISLCPFILNILDLTHSHKCTYHIDWDTGKRGDMNYAFSRSVASIKIDIIFCYYLFFTTLRVSISTTCAFYQLYGNLIVTISYNIEDHNFLVKI